MPLDRFSAATATWFAAAFDGPTAAQSRAWEAISRGDNTLVVAPTGSGKTLAAFLWALDRLATEPRPDEAAGRCRVLYVSPLKALAVDVDRNLRTPLAGITAAARELGLPEPRIDVAMRTGDTPANERRRFLTTPPDILITTPESLFLLLTSSAREKLQSVRTVIVDEVHAVAGTKRGAHLALSLERLDARLPAPAQRIGLSATVRPVDEVARFLGGTRPVTVVQPPTAKTIDVQVQVPIEDMTSIADEPARSIWPHLEERIADLVAEHRSTIVFANSRRLAERLTARLNEIAAERLGAAGPEPNGRLPAQIMAQSGSAHGADPVIARAHHGSVSREQRLLTEEALKAGTLPAVVATSSLELGIDMGAVDLVVQVESPPSVASGMQRVGRAGHHVGAVSRGIMLPNRRSDLLASAVVAQRMAAGAIEELHYPRNPLDVLAQQVVAMVAMDDWSVADLLALVRRTANFADLTTPVLAAVLDMLAGRYPSEEFAELRPRLVWDRAADTLHARPGAQRLAITSGGTIPDRGLYGVFLSGEQRSRVGELDEEMVYESRVGDVFALGSTSWRIDDITHDRVLVSPAPGRAARLPFWKGDTIGRPFELGAAIGAVARELSELTAQQAADRLTASGLDTFATGNLLTYLDAQRTATGQLPDDRTVIVERFRDELGDWRVVIHSPFGGRVHAPWALAIGARLRERYGVDVQTQHGDDGIVLRIPDTVGDGVTPPGVDLALFTPEEIEPLVIAELGGSALFAGRFRECAARALLLPRRTPGRRSPLWQQRQRASQLLAVASGYAEFPIALEAMRECLQDIFDVDGLVHLMRQVASREIKCLEVETPVPSPYAGSLMMAYVATYLYGEDMPLAERRAQALSLDTVLLAELMGAAGLRELLDSSVIDDVAAELQRLAPDRRVRDLEQTADLLRSHGPLSTHEAVRRGAQPAWLGELARASRAFEVTVAGERRWAVVEDAARLRDALGTAVPVDLPAPFLERVRDPVGDLVARYARTHPPFRPDEVAAWLGIGVAPVTDALTTLTAAGRLVRGDFLPDGTGAEWCDSGVLGTLRRRSLARARHEVEPVAPGALGRLLPAWQHLPHQLHGVDGVLRVVEQLAGVAVPASALEPLVLASRVLDYSPALLDELTAAGEVTWSGAGALPHGDGWISLHPAGTAPLTLAPLADIDLSPLHRAILDALAVGAQFFRPLSDRIGSTDDTALVAALWDLVWAGYLTNDTLAPLRTILGAPSRPRPAAARRRPTMPSRSGPPTAAGRWSVLPERNVDLTRRAHALADGLLDRYGVVTRGAVTAERVPGGFASVYKVLRAFEESGRCRRGYFVDGLGAAQFALTGAVERLRSTRGVDLGAPAALVLAATDPANAYGASLPWPAREQTTSHVPGRKVGALVVLLGGELVCYAERGGRTLLTWADDPAALAALASALANAVKDARSGPLAIERVDGIEVNASALAPHLLEAGFHPTPKGLRIRR